MGALLDEVRQILANFRGPEPLRKLFWEVLGYDRVNEPLPDSKLPGEVGSHLTDARLLAPHDEGQK